MSKGEVGEILSNYGFFSLGQRVSVLPMGGTVKGNMAEFQRVGFEGTERRL